MTRILKLSVKRLFEGVAMAFEEEQEEILGRIDNITVEGKRGIWDRYNGDVCCRVIKEYAQRYIPKSWKIVGPNVYADTLPF